MVTAYLVGLRLTISFSADNYKVGDTLYVWAKSGLTLREGPSVKFARIDALGFGSPVVVVAKSEAPFNVQAFTPAPKEYLIGRVEPVIFYGHWVKVRTHSGQIGNVIDQYLLPIVPIALLDYKQYRLNIEILTVDTTFLELNRREDGPYLTTLTRYGNQIECSKTIDSKCSYASYSFHDFSIEEVLIVFSSSWEDFDRFQVGRNWVDSTQLIESLCQIDMTRDGNIIRVDILCSYC